MNEVSCKVFEILIEPLAAKRVSVEDLVEGTGVSPARLRDKKERIDWADYVAIMRNVRPHFSDEEYRELGRSYMRSPGLRFAFVIARLVFSPLDIYRWFNKPREGVGNQMFTCIVPSHHEPAPNQIVLELTLPDGYEVCWDFFLISSGNMEELPRLFGLPRAKLELSQIPRGARMEIEIASPRIPILQRIWRFVTWPFTARSAARELKKAHETLALQATQLRTAHTITGLAQRALELGPALDTIAKALVEQAGFASAEIELGDGSRIARAGMPNDQPKLERTLTARAGQPIARLAVCPDADAVREEREELLEFIVPGLAIAIENAVYRSDLERLVDRRTAELRVARDELSGTVDQLRQAQGSRERFFSYISHEIRTPLSIIMLASSDLDMRTSDILEPRLRSRFGIITDATRKLVRLVDELLLLAAGHEGKLRTNPEPTDLAALVRLLEAAWRPAAERAGLTMVTRIPESLHANIDPVAIERVATNLISNAVKYTPEGGTIEVELAIDEGIRFSVLDTGPGIADDLATRLFERFERGDSRGIGGTGLGLSLSKQLVEAHRGTIAAHARDQEGTELRVVLPAELVLADRTAPSATQLRLVDGPPEAADPLRQGARLVPAGLSRGTVLLAEDDTRLAEMIAELLSDEYTVIVAHDGNAALEMMRRHQPQLLVTDVDMPGLDGIELSRRFREQTGERLAPIIILSAMLDLGTRVAGLDAGATDYVSKPFDPLELKARVRAQFRMRDLALRLHRAEQLSALGVLTAGLAHELRNPANGIINAIPPLREQLPAELLQPAHPVAQLFEVVAECAEQVNQLARQLLGFREGGNELDTRQIRLRDIVDRALALSRDAFADVELTTTLPPSDEPLSCAPPLMLQVLINLLENAAYAAGKGGQVEIAARIECDKLVIEISDSGGGVPAELRERVFEPFFTTKPVGVGTGLGLPLARDIVHRHGGTLDIRDRGARAAFVIELPARRADVAAAG